MLQRLKTLAASIRNAFSRDTDGGFDAEPSVALSLRRALPPLLILTAVTGLGYAVVTHPPVQAVPHGQAALRTNQFSGGATEFRDGSFVRLPGLHEVRFFPLRDQSYHPDGIAKAGGPAPLQSVEGLSLGLDMTVRWAVDERRLAELSRKLPDNIEAEVIAPAVQAVVYKQIAKHTVREIFSSQRAEIASALEAELRAKLASDGIVLKSVQIGSVDLPPDYRRGMDNLLADSLASERMRYTLEIADKKVKETELQAAADKVRRETAAEAAGREQVIAARAQEEAMKHVLPFKQKQIEQRALEAQADSAARVQQAEGAAKARRIEIDAEAAARQKLADAEAYRLNQIGKANAGQMAAEGALLTKHPLLVQKAMADKLSDKVQVIIAPPGSGGFIGNALLGGTSPQPKAAAEGHGEATAEKE
ncbi:regulator of protease activity HflC (stomatin/prohibitin superfamily) [Pelomonas saccharophila]|uniref:Regulator of protease activity HflC (Stomatin/prohibitin superfamily) n=1 Tax=Roseateles saccharophilus TaxID=304 RepID=A0ABU1YPG2_ROSSA|nr:SPFH domain-containing protein [Roseateles saccharophilus]MDR7270751.1 regulator of protease activity HflC (stomatin/prohibitin superfamily) [Roseateles saccharophilus]